MAVEVTVHRKDGQVLHGGSWSLQYRFVAVFKDGSFYCQNLEDKSLTDPDKRSCFYDVIQKGLDQVKEFYLVDGQSEAKVNLETGLFYINGEEKRRHEGTVTDLKLIYYREHDHHWNMQSGAQTGHDIAYCLGWEGKDSRGQKIKRILKIKT